MGLFSSSKSSSSSQTYDNRVVSDGGSVAASGNAQVNVLDGAAISSAFEFAKEQQNFAQATFGQVLGLAGQALKASAETVVGSGNQVAAAYSEAKGEGTTKIVIYAALAALVAVVALGVMRKRG